MQEVDPFQSRLDEKAWLPTFLLKNSSVTVQNSSPQSQQLNHSSSTVFDSSQSHALLNSDIHDLLISKALRLSTVSFLQCKELKAVVSEDLATNKTYYPSCSMTWHGSLNLYHLHWPIRTAKEARWALSPVTNWFVGFTARQDCFGNGKVRTVPFLVSLWSKFTGSWKKNWDLKAG